MSVCTELPGQFGICDLAKLFQVVSNDLGFCGQKERIELPGAHCNLCPDGALFELRLLEPPLDLSHRINSIVCHSRGFWSVLRQV